MKMIETTIERAASIRAFMSTPKRTIGLSLMRVILGLVMLEFYVQHWLQYSFLWGNAGVVPYLAYKQLMLSRHGWSLYMLSDSPAFAICVFVTGILVTFAYTIGYKTRLTAVLFYLFTWSLYSRNPFALEGGDNLLYLLSFYMMFTDCGAYFSIDAAKARARGERRVVHPLNAMLSNFGVTAILLQLCILYFTSGFFKCQGAMWQNGTAIYYVLRTAEFNLSSITHFFYDNDYVVTLLTWSTMVFQLAWPFLVWFHKPRRILFLGALMLHASIGYFMGLIWFSTVMITAELIIFADSEYLQFAEQAGVSITYVSGCLSAWRTRLFALPEVRTQPKNAVQDGD